MKILVVDDSIFAQKSVIRFLKTYLEVTQFYTAKSGKEALEIYKKESPDYCFVDLLMPEMTGQDLIKNIKEIDENAKIFVMSADVQKAVKDEVEELGAIKFISKPFNRDKALEVFEIIKGDLNA